MNKYKMTKGFLLILAGALFAASPAFADDGGWIMVLGNVENLASAGRTALLAVFYVGGLGLAGYGLWTCYQSLNPQKQKSFGLGAGAFLVGVFLVILPNIIGLTAESTDGSGDDATERVQEGWD